MKESELSTRRSILKVFSIFEVIDFQIDTEFQPSREPNPIPAKTYGFKLDPFQKKAIECLEKGTFKITFIFDFMLRWISPGLCPHLCW